MFEPVKNSLMARDITVVIAWARLSRDFREWVAGWYEYRTLAKTDLGFSTGTFNRILSGHSLSTRTFIKVCYIMDKSPIHYTHVKDKN